MNDGLFNGFGNGVRGTNSRFAWQEVTTSQAVAPPPWAMFASIWGCGGGGGGGGGRLGLTTAASGGAGGGGAGSRYIYRIPLFIAKKRNVGRWTVTIGAGGSGGAGSNTDGVDGTNGTAGGNTTAVFFSPGEERARYTLGIQGNGGGGGQGGRTTTPTGGSGGGSTNGTLGGSGGNGSLGNFPQTPVNTTSGAQEPTYPVMGGMGAPAKQGSSWLKAEGSWGCSAFGQFTGTNGYQNASGGENGDHALENTRGFAETFFNRIQRAPLRDELWWATFFGGMCGVGGSTASLINGGNGGNGFRGSGGGGGGGAGFTGAVGGTGGTGGSGSVIFFWEET